MDKISLVGEKQSQLTLPFWTSCSIVYCLSKVNMSTVTTANSKQPTSYLTVCTPELNDRLLRLIATQLGFHLALSILFQANLGDGISKFQIL